MDAAALRPVVPLARILLALIFVLAGTGKILNTAPAVAAMASHGIPFANILVYAAIAVELGGGLMLIAGLFTRWVGAALFFYTLALAVIFHAYWAAPAAMQGVQHGFFFGHLSIMGGMLMIVAFGAGPYSLDALIQGEPSD